MIGRVAMLVLLVATAAQAGPIKCLEVSKWDALEKSNPLLEKDPRRLGDGWDSTGIAALHRYRCTPDTVIKTAPAEERAAFWAAFDAALAKAGDHCSRERAELQRLVSGPNSGGFLQAWASRGYVAALWRCDRSGGENADRACAWAQAPNDAAWDQVKRWCPACSATTDAVDACRQAFGSMDADRERCVRLYQPTQDAMRSVCVPG